ncbi:MAG: type IV secretory system conjugative DNA transfer family protein [Candidatus Thiodiazotropha sp. LLP2]
MDEEFYTRYSHGSSDLGGIEHACSLAQGLGPVAMLGGEIIRFQPQHPNIVIGGAGSGKFAVLGAYQLVHPSMQSFFILDVGGQYMNVTWHYNLAMDREVYAINPQGVGAYPDINHPVHLWGILKVDTRLFDNARTIAGLSLTESDMQGENAWVGQDARRWITRFLTSIVLLEGRVTPLRLIDFIHTIDTDDEYLKYWGMGCADLPNDEYSTFVEINRKKHGSVKEYGAIMGKIKSDLDWLSSRSIAASISGDIDYLAYLADPNKKVGVYYVVESGTTREMESLNRLVVGIGQLHCARSNKGALPVFYLEEAASCGKAEFIKKAVSQDRKHYTTVLIYQSGGQLILLFGKAGAQEILESCGTQIYLGGGIREIDGAKRLADSIGKKTIQIDNRMAQADRAHRAGQASWEAMWNGRDMLDAELAFVHEVMQSGQQSQTGRYLIDPAELMRLKNHVLVLSPGEGLPSLLADKLPNYWQNPAMIGRYGPDPLHSPLDRVAVPGRWFKRHLPFLRRAVPEHLADWPNHINGEIAYVDGYRTW